jgi:hypothetical protein
LPLGRCEVQTELAERAQAAWGSNTKQDRKNEQEYRSIKGPAEATE